MFEDDAVLTGSQEIESLAELISLWTFNANNSNRQRKEEKGYKKGKWVDKSQDQALK